MKMKMGDEIEDIKSEKFLFEKKENGRGRGRGERGTRGNKDNERGRHQFDARNARKGGSGGRAKQESGRQKSRGEMTNSRYAALRIKTKKQGTL